MSLLTENFGECPKKIEDRANCPDSAIGMFADSEACSSLYVKECKNAQEGKNEPPSNIGPSECDRDSSKDGCDPNSQGDDTTSKIRTGLNSIYKKANSENRIALCKLLELPTNVESKQAYKENYPLFTNYISGENNGCTENNIDKVRKRCLSQKVPLEACSISKLDELWNLCKKYNKEDTMSWDQEICPSKINPKDDYYTEWASDLVNKTPEERKKKFKEIHPDLDLKDNYQRKAWVHKYNLKRIPELKNIINKDKELLKDKNYKDKEGTIKYFPEIRVMKKCITKDYLAPINCDDYTKNGGVLDTLNELYESKEIDLDTYIEYEKAYKKCNKDVEHEGKMTNRFCDWGHARSYDFYNNIENYSGGETDPKKIKHMLNNNIAEKKIKNDEDYFSVYTGTYFDDTIGKENPYIQLSEIKSSSDKRINNRELINARGYGCVGENSSDACIFKDPMHPENKIDSELGEDSECVTEKRGSNYSEGKCDSKGKYNDTTDNNTGCKQCGQRKFYKSLNCKYKTNENNIYKHGCEDPFAACVKLATPKELKDEFLKYKKDANGNITVVKSNLSSPKLKYHNFLSTKMIKDREFLWASAIGYKDRKENYDKLTDEEKEIYQKEGIYKCMRCGLRGTVPDEAGLEQDKRNELYDREKPLVSSRDPYFLIFTTTLNKNNEIEDSNCNENYISWYEYEKNGLLDQLDSDRALRKLDMDYSTYMKGLEKSEENIIRKTNKYYVSSLRRKKRIEQVQKEFNDVVPELKEFIKLAEDKVRAGREERLANKKTTDHLNKYFYIIGFIVFLILILFLVF